MRNRCKNVLGVNGGPEQIYAACQLDAETVQAIESCRAEGQGLALVGAHMCSFDILLLAVRQRLGIEVTPVSGQALRQAVQRLPGGGIVAVAVPVGSRGC